MMPAKKNAEDKESEPSESESLPSSMPRAEGATLAIPHRYALRTQHQPTHTSTSTITPAADQSSKRSRGRPRRTTDYPTPSTETIYTSASNVSITTNSTAATPSTTSITGPRISPTNPSSSSITDQTTATSTTSTAPTTTPPTSSITVPSLSATTKTTPTQPPSSSTANSDSSKYTALLHTMTDIMYPPNNTESTNTTNTAPEDSPDSPTEEKLSTYCKCLKKYGLRPEYIITDILIDEGAAEVYFLILLLKRLLTWITLILCALTLSLLKIFGEEWKSFVGKCINVNFSGNFRRTTVNHFLQSGRQIEKLKMDVVYF
uniref:Uncharacterized protein n=1 Tax=Panagrolaimus superbus TaxID=310955 RepID=A0A914Y604_9BILA